MIKIAFLGLGTMGGGIVQNLLKSKYDVTIWNRTLDKCSKYVDYGAKCANSPHEAVKDAEVIMYSLSDDNAVEDLLFGNGKLYESVKEGQIIIDMSTVSPSLSKLEYEKFSNKKVDFLDAPVFGSKNEAINAGLWIIVGGKMEVYKKVKHILEAISESVHYMGKNGMGTSMKLVGNLIVAFQLEAISEALILAKKANLDIEKVLEVIHVTDFKSPIFDSVGKAILSRDFSTNFALKLMLKDANLISGFAQELVAPIPGLSIIRENLKAAYNNSLGDENAHAFIKILEQQGNILVN